MKRSAWNTHLTLTVLAMLGLVLGALQVRAQSDCINVRGTETLSLTGPTTAEGPVTGDLTGTVSVTVTALQQSGDGALHAQAVRTFFTAGGEIHTEDVIVLSPVAPPIYRTNERLTIVGGTGAYAGAASVLHIHGLVNFATGAVSATYHGRICPD
jgi:hypothetical protein